MQVGDWIAVVSAVVAVLSLGANWLVVRRQTRLQAEELRLAADTAMLAWASETLDAFGESAAIAEASGREGAGEGGAGLARERTRLAHRLSALADRGRLFFPNVDPESRGQEKHGAFKGRRQPALDAVIFAYDAMRGIDRLAPSEAAAVVDILFQCRRVMISEVQAAVDPRRRAEIVDQLARREKRDVEDGKAHIQEIRARMRALGVADSFD